MKLCPLQNEKGASALLIVMAVGAILAGFILSLQMYVSTRARMVSRIRLAYKYTFVMEDAAKIILNGRLERLAAPCDAPKVSVDVSNGLGVLACLPTLRDLCINGAACICTQPNWGDPAACAALSVAKNLKYTFSDETMIAFNSFETDESLLPALDFSFMEKIIPEFDRKYIAFIDRVVFRRPTQNLKLFNEATAAANSSYAFDIANPNPLRRDGATAPVGVAPPPNTSPAPDAPENAFTFRQCSPMGGGDPASRCVDIRVCVTNAKEPALGDPVTSPQICFQQRITRSFLWSHIAEPCASSACPTPADPNKPLPGEKGSGPDAVTGCPSCPWRDRF